jgi:hypothetical protein
MFKKNTLLILGAGASRDLDFPLGRGFKAEIAKLNAFSRVHEKGSYDFLEEREVPSNPDFEQSVRDYIAKKGIKATDSLPSVAAHDIKNAMQMIAGGVGFAPSIDVFLKMRAANPLIVHCAKAAIAALILQRERNARRYLVRPENVDWYPDLEKTWYQAFCEICFSDTEGAGQIEEALSRLSIISFNYDRCIEQLLCTAVECLYSLPRPQAAALAATLDPLHPYGSLGKLPSAAGEVGVPFGADINSIDAAQMFDGIKTIGEQPLLQSEIQKTVAAAKNIIFLGFGYHKPNLDLLLTNQPSATGIKHVYGTCFDMSKTETEVIRSTLAGNFRIERPGGSFQASVKLENMNCTQLLDEYRSEFIEQ